MLPVGTSVNAHFILVGRLESPGSLKFANTTAITSTVMLHRAGKNNRKVVVNSVSEKDAVSQSTKVEKRTDEQAEKPPTSTPYSLYLAFALFLIVSALHVLSIPAVISLIDPTLYHHYPLLKSIEIEALQPYLAQLHTQIGLWILLGLTMARILSVPTPTD